jgi:hypothetical protein
MPDTRSSKQPEKRAPNPTVLAGTINPDNFRKRPGIRNLRSEYGLAIAGRGAQNHQWRPSTQHRLDQPRANDAL